MAAAKRRAACTPSPTQVRVTNNGVGKPHLELPCTDEAGWMALAMQAFGTVSPAFIETEIERMMNVLNSSSDDLSLEAKMNAAIAVIEGLKPKNETEAMLAVEMAVTHAVSMGLLGRVSRTSDLMIVGDLAIYGNIAAKFLRAYTGQIEAFAKLRRSLVQVVRVESITVSGVGRPPEHSAPHAFDKS
jgi:hypothetical protein